MTALSVIADAMPPPPKWEAGLGSPFDRLSPAGGRCRKATEGGQAVTEGDGESNDTENRISDPGGGTALLQTAR